MKKPARWMISTTLALGILGASSGVSLASHEHYLVTPGTCVADIASGQTSIADTELGGYHQFHMNVHLGQPGKVDGAFANTNNPVSVGKGACPAA